MSVLYKHSFEWLFYESGTHLLSHIVSNIVPSAAYALTVVFGMGTGVSHKRIGTGIFLKPLSGILLCLFLGFSLPSLKLQQYIKPLLLLFLRKEVIQPHLPIRLPCYDFTPVIHPAFGSSLLFWLGH